jgi:MFS transporter, DHA1 family, multidrug resistance protein
MGRLRLVVILGSLTALGPLSVDLYLPGLPELTRDFGARASEGQLTLTACLAGLALGQLLAGPLSDRFGRRGPLLVGLVAYCAASLACALAPSIYALVALRLLQGFAGAAGIVIARAVVRDVSSGVAAARLFSALMLVFGVAPVLAPVVGGQLLHVTSWRGLFVTLALIGLPLLLATAFWLEETLPPERRGGGGWRQTTRTFRRLAHDRMFVGFALCTGCAFAAMLAYIAGSPFVVQEIYGVSPGLYGVIFGVNSLGLIACSQLNGMLVGRLGLRRLLGVGLVLGASAGCSLLAIVLVGGVGLAGILPCFFVVVASLGFVAPNATALALADYPDVAGSASALLGVVHLILGAASAPLVGVAGAESAVPMAALIAAFGVAAVAALALSRGHVVAQAPSPAPIYPDA